MEKIFRRVDVKATGCWEWQGAKDEKGYGLININKKTKRVHRLVFESVVGPIPQGQMVCHKCDNPRCVNPSHLFTGTALDNNRDREAKGRGADRNGEKHPGAKLTDIQVLEIKAMGKEKNLTHSKIAEQYNVTRARVSQIIRGVDKRKTQRQFQHKETG